MLGSKYISIAGSALPNPSSYSEDFERVESTYTTESGDKKILIKSSDKIRISLSFNATSYLRDKLKNLYSTRTATTVSVSGTVYQNAYIESFSAELVSGSERTQNTTGLWRVDMSIKQL